MTTATHVEGTNAAAPFTLKVHRGESMVLLAMDWRNGEPPSDFVGFAIEYKEPKGTQFFALNNRVGFKTAAGAVNPQTLSTKLSPIQKFRWVHFPFHAEIDGDYTYRVTPVFMDAADALIYKQAQEVEIALGLDTYPGELNVAFTRGFVSSQAFVDNYTKDGHTIAEMLPATAAKGLTFVPTHPLEKKALEWMGFESRDAILGLLDDANADKNATVRVVAYDLNEPEVVSRLESLGARLRIIIDDSKGHTTGSAENQAATRLKASAGAANVIRQKMLNLQHNKFIVVDGPVCKTVVCGSTNFSWRAFFVQANNAVVLHGAGPVAVFGAAFEEYWLSDPKAFQSSPPAAKWVDAGLPSVKAMVTFSPHSATNAVLATMADYIQAHTTSNLFFSLAFLYQTAGAMRDAIKKLVADDKIFIYGMSDRRVGGLDIQEPSGNLAFVEPAALAKNLPQPFKAEPTGGGGIRMHHKFIVMDFGKPNARVFLGSYNFSKPADVQNGENLLVFQDDRVVTAYVVEALRLFDHYQFRVKQQDSEDNNAVLALARPPRAAGELPWWKKFYTDPRKVKERKLFA